MAVGFTQKVCGNVSVSFFPNLGASFPGPSTRFGPKIRFPNSIYSQKMQYGNGDHQKLSNFVVMAVRLPQKVCCKVSVSFVASFMACFPGASTRFGPKISFQNSIYSQKLQFGHGDHQKLSNFIAMAVVFTPQSLL